MAQKNNELAMTSRRPPLSFISALLPDQTLYSWVTMYHHLSGNALEEQTLVQLFGSDKAGRLFHLPSNLDPFCASTQLVLGAPERLISVATILPAYLRFRPSTIANDVLMRIRSPHTAGIAQLLRIAHSRLYTFAPRRLCRHCIEEDLASHGFAYWHRTHQLPGVLVCTRHTVELTAIPMQSRDTRRAGFVKPELDLIQAGRGSSPSHYSAADLHILVRLANLSSQVATQLLPGGYSRIAMREACLSMLRQRKLYSDDTMECLLKATRQYLEHFRQVAWIPELAGAANQQAAGPLWNLFAHTQHPDHPLEFILLIDWLFGDWQTFLDQYKMHQLG